MTMTSNISHSITTSTNGGPCSWYNTRSSPQLEIHSHRVPSMRILDLILLTSLVLILLTRLSLILPTSFTIQHHTSIIWGYIGLDMTRKSNLILLASLENGSWCCTINNYETNVQNSAWQFFSSLNLWNLKGLFIDRV